MYEKPENNDNQNMYSVPNFNYTLMWFHKKELLYILRNYDEYTATSVIRKLQ